MPRLWTSLISGPMEAYTGMRIVLVGRLRERVLLWCVFISLAVDKEKRHHFIFLASLSDCDNLCYIRSSTLSVRHDLLHPMPCEFIHTVAIIPSVQNSDRCTPHTPYPRPSCGYLICLLRGLQNPDPVYATRICHNFLFLLPVLPKLYLLLSWRNR